MNTKNDEIEVSKSTTIDKDLATVWEKVGAFTAIQDWHPAVDKCESYEEDGKTFRKITLVDGAELIEEHKDSNETSYSYSINSGPLPVQNYIATFKTSGDENSTTISWQANFNALDDQAQSIVEGIFDSGLNTIKEMFKK